MADDEITEFLELYIVDSGLFEEEVSKISRTLEGNIKDVIAPGNVGYNKGHLHDSIVSDYEVDGLAGVVTAWFGPDYGQYWYRWKGGKDFLNVGLEETLKNYR